MHKQSEAGDHDREIYEILSDIGVPVRLIGYRYMEEALRILLLHEDAAYAITKKVYMKIARAHGTSDKQVEGAIRTAVRAAWCSGRCEQQERVFGYSMKDRDKPCNSEFLLRIMAYLRYKDH